MKLRLIENDYAILAKFEGRCSISTYLMIVIQRLLADYRNHLWGKWRPSAAISRMGDVAMRIEMMLSRDQHTPDEAFEALRDRGESISREEFDAVVSAIPERRPRMRAVDANEIDNELAIPAGMVEEKTAAGERAGTARVVEEAVRASLDAMPTEDRAILRLHFEAGWKVSEIARSMHLDQKRLYRRIRSICEGLRAALTAAGIDVARASELIGQPETEFDFGLQLPGNAFDRPSFTLRDVTDGEGRST